MSRRAAPAESIRALATVTLDARAIEQLGPQAIDRLADLVAARLGERGAMHEDRMLSVQRAAAIADVHPDTIRRAVRTEALRLAGYAGNRPRVRRSDLDEWIAAGRPSASGPIPPSPRRLSRRTARKGAERRRVMGDALELGNARSAAP